MADEIPQIHQSEARSLIKRLMSFLGEYNVQKAVERYERSMLKSGPLIREYYLKDRHPWFRAFTQYYDLIRKGKSINRNLTPELQKLAIDGKKVITVQEQMPRSVKKKFKRDLLDIDSARNYLFEIEIAFHFFQKGGNIQWYEDVSGMHPEFLVKTPGLDFNVECKRISVDIARRIHRKDFAKLAQNLLPDIQKRGYSGSVDIVLEERLTNKSSRGMCVNILELIDEDSLRGHYKIQNLGSVDLDLKCAAGSEIDITERCKAFYKSRPEKAHGAFLANAKGNKGADPIELTVMCEKADTVLDGIRDKISNAEEQLDESKPGFIVCFLEDIRDFDLHELSEGSGLQIMTCNVLAKKTFAHVAGISYSVESIVAKEGNCEEFINRGLLFRNPNCKFEEAKAFEFLLPPRG